MSDLTVPAPGLTDTDALGRLVREVWIEWAREQPDPKPSWLVGWDDLPEPDREVDRRIGARLANEGAARVAAAVAEAWPCDAYLAPLTCYTTPKPKTLICEGCRAAFPTGPSVRAALLSSSSGENQS